LTGFETQEKNRFADCLEKYNNILTSNTKKKISRYFLFNTGPAVFAWLLPVLPLYFSHANQERFIHFAPEGLEMNQTICELILVESTN
jgi:hypothetical protein